jgi:hypothetical protein
VTFASNALRVSAPQSIDAARFALSACAAALL